MFQCFVQAPDMSNEDIIRGTNQIKERVQSEALSHEALKDIPLLEEELEINQIKGIYLRCKYDIEESVQMYLNFIQWRRYSLTHSLTYSLTYSLTHSLTQAP